MVDDEQIITEYQKLGSGIKTVARLFNLRREKVEQILKQNHITIKNLSEIKSQVVGENHSRYGKKPPKGSGRCRWYHYNGKTYQGTWEFKVGLWLEQQNKNFYCHENVKQFKYELNGFEKTYCPDFYLPDENVFVEVKGYFTKEDRQKIEIVKQLYPNEKIEIFDESRLLELQILNIDKEQNLILDEYEIHYKKDKSLNDFFSKHEQRKNEIVKDFLFNKLNLSELAKKYDTPYRIINQIYHLWIEDYFKNENLREEFFEKYCKEELNDEFSKNCDLNSLIKRCRISRETFNKIITDDAKQKRIEKQKEKYNENYSKHLLKFNLPEITQELKSKVISEYQNQKSIHEICKKHNLRKKKVKKILIESSIEIRNEKFYTEKKRQDRNDLILKDVQEEITKEYNKGIGIRELGRKFNMTRRIIKKMLVEQKVDIKLSSYYSSIVSKKEEI